METILRAAALYLIVWLVMRVTGKRTLAQVTIFDFVLLLIISQAGQQALLGDDLSLTNAFLIIVTLIGIHLLFTLAAYRWPAFDKFANDVPLVLIADGEILHDRMQRSRVSEDDILEQARMAHGWRGWTRSSTRCSNAPAASPSYPARRGEPPRPYGRRPAIIALVVEKYRSEREEPGCLRTD